MFNLTNQKFGFELEFSGISRDKAIRTVVEALRSTRHSSNIILDEKNREWRIVRDGSVNVIGDGDQNELVSPPLTYEDMPLVQEVVRKLRKAGAKVDQSCGIHVHIDLQNHSIRSLKNLVKYYAKYENMFYKACQVFPNRTEHYAKRFNEKHPELISKINTVRNLDDFRDLWYHEGGDYHNKYDQSRYCGLNFHNIWYKGWFSGTVEFRFFNATLHAGEIRAYITLALGISAKALNARSVVANRSNEVVPDEFLFPKVLASMGITSGDPLTKNVYKHLTKAMKGQTTKDSSDEDDVFFERIIQQFGAV